LDAFAATQPTPSIPKLQNSVLLLAQFAPEANSGHIFVVLNDEILSP
jgi:hypothetical protein